METTGRKKAIQGVRRSSRLNPGNLTLEDGNGAGRAESPQPVENVSDTHEEFDDGSSTGTMSSVRTIQEFRNSMLSSGKSTIVSSSSKKTNRSSSRILKAELEAKAKEDAIEMEIFSMRARQEKERVRLELEIQRAEILEEEFGENRSQVLSENEENQDLDLNKENRWWENQHEENQGEDYHSVFRSDQDYQENQDNVAKTFEKIHENLESKDLLVSKFEENYFSNFQPSGVLKTPVFNYETNFGDKNMKVKLLGKSHVPKNEYAVRSEFGHKQKEGNKQKLLPINESMRIGHDSIVDWVNESDPHSVGDIVVPLDTLTQAFTNAMKVNAAPTNPVTNSNDQLHLKQLVSRQALFKDLPIFSGTPEDWPTFITHYRESTLTCGFTDSENVQRLQKALKGEARETVIALLSSPKNVDRVIKSLERRFGRPNLIIETLVQKVKSYAPPKDDDFNAIVSYGCMVENLVGTMENLNYTGHFENPTLIQQLVDKLPVNLRLQWATFTVTKETANLKDLSAWMVKMADAVSSITHLPKKPASDSRKTHNGHHNRNAHSVLVTTSKPAKKCGFCNLEGHGIYTCKNYLKESLDNRWKWIREKRFCFCCLGGNHRLAECKRRKECGVDSCKQHHHSTLHQVRSDSSNQMVLTHCQNGGKTLMKVLPVTIFGPKISINTYAQFDDAASTTMIDKDLADRLGIDGVKKPATLQWTNGIKRTDHSSKIVNVQVQGRITSDIYTMKNAVTIKNLSLPWYSCDVDKLGTRWPHLKYGDVLSMELVQPMILIAGDNAHLAVSQEVFEGPKSAPVLSRTRLGWCIHGPSGLYEGRVDNDFMLHCNLHMSTDEEIHQLVKSSFSTEDLGVKISSKQLVSKEEERAECLMSKFTRKLDNRYETCLLWKSDQPSLPSNRNVALRRLQLMEKQMDKDASFATAYCEKIQEMIQKGYASPVNDKATVAPGKLWYLPHFCVRNPNKPGKVRLVYDAAARSSGVSLNDSLLKGGDLYCNLVSVLFKFRQFEIALGGDIREMFLQVKIREEDRCAQRFLWRGMDRNSPPKEYQMDVMIFGSVSSPYCAQYIKNVNAKEFQERYPAAADAIINQHYVDDFLGSVSSEEEAIQLIKDISFVHQQAGFEMVGWISNSSNVLKSIPENRRAVEDKDLCIEDSAKLDRMLGLQWNRSTDQFTFKCGFHKVNKEVLSAAKRPSKREVLRVVMSVFDPLGFLGNFTIMAKIILQDIWRTGIGWDDPVTEVIFSKWKSWISILPTIQEVKLPRCYSPSIPNSEDIQLHVFVDESEKAFAAVAYFRISTPGSVPVISFVMSKTRVAPLKPISIPRLELQAAVIGVRMAKFIKENHSIRISSTYFWSDSRTVLCWIRSDARRYKQFVSHRIGEILGESDSSSWSWIPTALNVADDATRDAEVPDLSSSSRWFSGPPFLCQDQSDWPAEPQSAAVKEDDEVEVKADYVLLTREVGPESLPDYSRFSSWSKLVRSTAYFYRFADNLRVELENRGGGPIKLCELVAAERSWIQFIQQESFSEEIIALQTGNPLPKSSRLLKLSPYLNEFGIICVRGRIDGSNATATVKHPPILEPKHPVTRLLLQYHHEICGHHGKEYLANFLRQRYWIIDLRSSVRSTWSRCQRCKNQRSVPHDSEMGDLPDARLHDHVPAFTYCGVDYFGPYEVSIGRRREKRYGVLFTCFSTRAIHLEIAHSLTTDSCILAIRRFIARTFEPKMMFSDNGTNFRGADKELRQAMEEIDKDEILSQLSSRGINWSFIPPASPHMGGSWERLVGSVKSALKHSLKPGPVKEEVLQTVFAEAEYMVNSRPLTYVSADPDDLESLTPNHFLIGSAGGPRPYGIVAEKEMCLRRQWRYSQQLADRVWKRWITEYLPTLTKRTKWFKSQKPIQVDDVVILVDNTMPRNVWPKGLVTAVYPEKDNKIRVVDVKTQFGTFRRPVAKCCILDVRREEPNDGPSEGSNVTTQEEVQKKSA